MTRIAFVIAACLLCALKPSPAAENLIGGALSTEQRRNSFSAEEQKRVETIRSQSHVVSASVSTLNAQALNYDEISVNLPNGEAATYRAISKQRSSDETLLWKGASTTEVVDGKARDIAEFFSRPSKQSRSAPVLGWLVWKGVRYEVDFLKDGVAVIVQVNTGTVPQHPKDWKEIQERSKGNSKNRADGQSINLGPSEPSANVAAANQSIYTANLLFAVTPQAASYFGGALQTRIDQVVFDVNNIFANSNTSLRIQRVGGISTQALDYSSIGFAHSRGYSIDQMQERDAANADLVVTIGMYGNDGCGIARVYASAEDSHILLKANCLFLSKNLAHELGHILGGHHPIEYDSSNDPFSWGHGYYFRDPSTLYPGKAYCSGTIMAAGLKFPNLANCLLDSSGKPDTVGDGNVDKFSTPIPEVGWPILGNSTSANMVRVISENSYRITTFRATKLASAWRVRLLQLIMHILD
ncbi:M12 family metallo-peptidase [Roseateles paludis]|jgi:hypothetical protein|uniref:M12 family metallo-peptidase n=1 Tax=Roseateles paludis TaxID=3145238 RepID=A0ABV0FX99_9BURK